MTLLQQRARPVHVFVARRRPLPQNLLRPAPAWTHWRHPRPAPPLAWRPNPASDSSSPTGGVHQGAAAGRHGLGRLGRRGRHAPPCPRKAVDRSRERGCLRRLARRSSRCRPLSRGCGTVRGRCGGRLGSRARQARLAPEKLAPELVERGRAVVPRPPDPIQRQPLTTLCAEGGAPRGEREGEQQDRAVGWRGVTARRAVHVLDPHRPAARPGALARWGAARDL